MELEKLSEMKLILKNMIIVSWEKENIKIFWIITLLEMYLRDVNKLALTSFDDKRKYINTIEPVTWEIRI